MKQIDEAFVTHIAHLSRLELTAEEVGRYTGQLQAILEYASHLPDLPPAQPTDHNLRVEDDIAIDRQDPHALLRNAVDFEDGYVKVPAILDKSES